MKRRGFTLIELLAVIVILAIIALIATPIVLDIIEDSKDSSIKRSIELYGKAVENSVAKAQLNGSSVPSGKYTTTDGKTLTNGNTTIKVDYDGAKTVCDVYISNEGTVSLKKCNVSDKDVEYTYGNKIYENGDVVYFDVTTGKTCDNYTEENSNTGYNGINGTGNQNSCLKFYAFNDYGSDKVNLILDHNTTVEVTWRLNGGNVSGPKEVLTQLKSDTSSWSGTETPENYTMDQTEHGDTKYTIDYSEYKARLITAGEISTITENTTWNEKHADNHYYFHDNSTTRYEGATGTNKYAWLFDNTDSCTTYGCNVAASGNFGYWTATSFAYYAGFAWVVERDGSVMWGDIWCFSDSCGDSSIYGVRPVIEVLKSKLD